LGIELDTKFVNNKSEIEENVVPIDEQRVLFRFCEIPQNQLIGTYCVVCFMGF
jgi:hypothetical protein